MKILGLDIGGTEIKAAIIDEKGNITSHKRGPTFAYEGGEALMNRIINIINEYGEVDRIGISTAGQIDAENGVVIFATDNIPGWTGIKIKERLESKFRLPIAVENDVNCSALGELYYGAGIGLDSFLCLTYGTGIGGAIVENKKIYRGSKFSAGEFGHMITHSHGVACTCGGKGCYEAYASTKALCRMTAEALKVEKVNGKEIFEYIANGNNIVNEVVDYWISEIVIGLTSLTHIFNPSHIIVGGGIMEQPIIIDKITKNLLENVMSSYKHVKVTGAKLGNMAGILGAVHLVKSIK